MSTSMNIVYYSIIHRNYLRLQLLHILYLSTDNTDSMILVFNLPWTLMFLEDIYLSSSNTSIVLSFELNAHLFPHKHIHQHHLKPY